MRRRGGRSGRSWVFAFRLRLMGVGMVCSRRLGMKKGGRLGGRRIVAREEDREGVWVPRKRRQKSTVCGYGQRASAIAFYRAVWMRGREEMRSGNGAGATSSVVRALHHRGGDIEPATGASRVVNDQRGARYAHLLENASQETRKTAARGALSHYIHHTHHLWIWSHDAAALSANGFLAATLAGHGHDHKTGDPSSGCDCDP